ncbi:MAG: hypothetical protein AAF581_19760 [Planctomycetota bacterium]
MRTRHRRRSTVAALLLACLLVVQVGCVGPNKLKRSLDRALKKGYVEHPLRAQLLFPVNLVFNHVAALTDLLILNPLYWWPDVFRGRGTSFEEAVGEPEQADAISPSPEQSPQS